MTFDREKFFEGYALHLGPLTPERRQALDGLLACIEKDAEISDVRWAAYMLATVKHECADTWRPIEEFGKGKNRPYGVPVKVAGADGVESTNVYYGRGYVQLTWKENYQKCGDRLGMGDELMLNPDLALGPEIAYRIMSGGMRKGWFTGKKLADCIHGAACDYKNARRIINALDQWQRIQTYAEKFERILAEAQPRADAVSGGGRDG